MRALGASRTSLVPGGVLAGPWVRDPLWRRARAVPSLDLRFADNKSLTDAVTGASLVTFTRASSGTFVNSAGVIQTAVTNLLLRSEEFDNATWARDSTVATANQNTAPNGTLTADKVAEDTSANFHAISQYVGGFASGAVATLSIYAKAAGRTRFRIQTDAGGGTGTADFDLSTVASTSGTGVFTAGSIQAVGDGWYRCSVRCTTSGAGSIGLKVLLAATSYGTSYTGDGTSGIYLWGAQLERASTVGEYIPTTSAINSAPRFDHNPTTGESLGLLVEEARTNLLLQSENFGTTWSANGLLAFGSGSTLNALIAPDGQTTADLITENTSNSQHNVNQVSTTTGAKRFSVFAKQGSGNRLLRLIDFNATDGAQGETFFNLSTGAVVSGPGTIQALPNGWYRCSIQSTTTVTSTYFISIATSALAFTYTGDGTSGIYLWGAQLEAGAFPTSYIPTTTAAVTRSADVASITGANFSSWYRQDEGTVFADINTAPVANIAQAVFDLSEGAGSERIFQRRNTGGFVVTAITDNSVVQGDFGSVSIPASGRARSGLAYRLNDFEGAVNGSSSGTDTSATVPTIDRIHIGQNFASGQVANGTIRRICFWPQRLANSTLQGITS